MCGAEMSSLWMEIMRSHRSLDLSAWPPTARPWASRRWTSTGSSHSVGSMPCGESSTLGWSYCSADSVAGVQRNCARRGAGPSGGRGDSSPSALPRPCCPVPTSACAQVALVRGGSSTPPAGRTARSARLPGHGNSSCSFVAIRVARFGMPRWSRPGTEGSSVPSQKSLAIGGCKAPSNSGGSAVSQVCESVVLVRAIFPISPLPASHVRRAFRSPNRQGTSDSGH